MNVGILEKIDEYGALLDRKAELEEALKEVKKEVDICKTELSDMMALAETPKVSRAGFSYSLVLKAEYSKKGGVDDKLIDALDAYGLGDIARRTVNAQTLKGTMKNLAEENGGELPDAFADLISVYEHADILRRKDTRKI